MLRSPGQPLTADSRIALRARFGHDFSRVRVHADERAAASADTLAAAAYTVGRHVVFARHQYRPGSTVGDALIAHEATHTLQQGLHDAASTKGLNVAPARHATEREADRNEASTARGTAASATANGTMRIARKTCLTGGSCKKDIKGSSDDPHGKAEQLEKDEAAMRARGESTWEFSKYFLQLVEQLAPDVMDLPTAWLVRKALPWRAAASYCPADLDLRDDPHIPYATGQRTAGEADHCVVVSPELEEEAKTFLTKPKELRIGNQPRDDWKYEARTLIRHEAAHVPIRREVVEKESRSAYPSSEHFSAESRPLNEAAGVLAELPLIFERAWDYPWDTERVAREAIRAKIRGPKAPPLSSGYMLMPLLERACCMIPCADVQARFETLVRRESPKWWSTARDIIVNELAAAPYCQGNVKLVESTLTPGPTLAPSRTSLPPIGPAP